MNMYIYTHLYEHVHLHTEYVPKMRESKSTCAEFAHFARLTSLISSSEKTKHSRMTMSMTRLLNSTFFTRPVLRSLSAGRFEHDMNYSLASLDVCFIQNLSLGEHKHGNPIPLGKGQLYTYIVHYAVGEKPEVGVGNHRGAPPQTLSETLVMSV